MYPPLLPAVAIVGRPNVGKSTLFNQLTRTRDAIVADEPGLTRDRHYGRARYHGCDFVVIDTGGLGPDRESITRLVAAQADRAIDDAQLIVFLLDARQGLTPDDEAIAARLRHRGIALEVIVNKTEGMEPGLALAEFHRLGLGEPLAVAAAHGRGLRSLAERIAARLATQPPAQTAPGVAGVEPGRIRVAIVGRPNVGKSSLINRLLGEERVLAHDAPGTTRDSIFVPFDHGRMRYTLIDTAGLRRRARVDEAVEKFSVVKTLQAVEAAHVVVHLLDATESVTEQDLRLLGHSIESGRGLTIGVNKWDAVAPSVRRNVRVQLERRLRFASYADTHPVSALRGTGLKRLLRSVDMAWRAGCRDLPTPELTRCLSEAVAQHPPPVVRGGRIKLRYAHQGGRNPPRIIIHGTKLDAVPDAYTRYLMRRFREAFDLRGTPIKLEYRVGDNPYRHRKNALSARQVRKRRRLMRHVKRGR